MVYINEKKTEFSNLSMNEIIDKTDFKKDKNKIVAVSVNGELKDLSYIAKDKDHIHLVMIDSKEGLEILRHSAAHIMALAIQRLYPAALPTIGPAVENGFYYDYDYKFSDEDLQKIEKEMVKIQSAKLPFTREELSIKDAKKLFAKNKYKIELIDELEEKGEKTVSVYKLGEFADLCRGPHVPFSSYVKAFKVTKLAGAYWRANAENAMLSRVYGIAFASQEDMKAYLLMMEEAEKRNHRKIGAELDLFSFHEEAPGMPFFHAKGMVIWNSLLDFWRIEHKKAGYVEIKTPIILNKSLWLQSGHWDHYKENMYFTKIDNADYAVKPMNCPGGMLVYKSNIHSYKELPIRAAEVGLVHRHELSGVLSGLFRVRCFHQDDAHLFVTPDQLEDEIKGVIRLVDHFYKDIFGFSYHVELSTRPEKSMGDPKIWEMAEKTLEKTLRDLGMNFKINPGDGAFYGPKIDFHIKDAIGRTWQCATCQLDFQMPDKFDLTYEGADGQKHRPIMLHRVVYGSIERFMGVLIEHFAGKFPLWLSPEQVRVVPVGHAFDEYATEVFNDLKDEFRATLDISDDTLGKKIRNAEKDKVNYVIVVGEKEQSDKTINVRLRGVQKQLLTDAKKFRLALQKEISERSLTSHLH